MLDVECCYCNKGRSDCLSVNMEAWEETVRFVVSHDSIQRESNSDLFKDTEVQAVLCFIQQKGNMSKREAEQYLHQLYNNDKTCTTGDKHPLWFIICICLGIIESVAAVLDLIISGDGILCFLFTVTAFVLFFFPMRYIQTDRQLNLVSQIWNSSKETRDANEMYAGLMKMESCFSDGNKHGQIDSYDP